MDASGLARASARDIAAHIVNRETTAFEVMRYFLDRIAAGNPALNAFITVATDSALDEAKKADKLLASGGAIGPLHGVPIGVKDLSSTKGIRTTFGSILQKDNIPDYDDIAVERIRATGAIVIGKTNTPEYGWKGSTENLLTGACHNPWDLSRTSGGSSGGSAAAVAAGLVPLATGSDAGGSIRIPASFCGVFGIKPTFGRIPSHYQSPGGWRQLSQQGAIASTVVDAALLLDAQAGPHDHDATSLQKKTGSFIAAALAPSVDGLRIAWSATLDNQPTDPEVGMAVNRTARAFDDLGARVEEAAPHIDTQQAIEVLRVLLLTDLAITLGPVMAGGYESALPSKLVEWLHEAQGWPATRYARALRSREWHRWHFDRFFERYDLLLTPTTAVAAFPIEAPPAMIDGESVDADWGYTPFCLHANLAGLPAASVPCGLSSEGLPLGVQIIGRRGEEATVLRASAAIEGLLPWKEMRPLR